MHVAAVGLVPSTAAMMKRHPSLIPLSHEHHDALVLAQGLILGRSRAKRSSWPTDRSQQALLVLEFYETVLRRHFEAEEATLFPVAVERLDEGPALVRQLLADHEEIRTHIRALKRTSATDLDTRLPALGKLLEAHIRTEERVLFERLQQEAAPADLETLGLRLGEMRPAGSPGPSCSA